MPSSRRRTHGAKPSTIERRRPARAMPTQGPRRAQSTSCGIYFLLPRAGSCLAGLALALQRRHRRRRAASNVGRRGGRRACIDEAFGRTTHEWCSACVVSLDPCSRSDVLTRTPSQSRGERNSGSSEVGLLCCIPNARALPRAIGRLSPLMAGANPKATLASHVLLASACDGAVRERRLGFSDSADAAGMGSSPTPICPENDAPYERRPRSPWTRPRPSGQARLTRRRRRRGTLPG